ncbi:hypothetical protein GUITHDRAFT_111962 [Guillardia theta CCMP2712]|uniref:Uncharacterized protein n=1 Tax=Guillardia theta (strain CCMP2712) TaxID=905079 RepID=L1J1Y9_GUITC|nr:hypothetical protein GUITHDRAFT_111962 [Guillardia theta CCMP2712]EKX42110.1 hypothetical protein GUITHDRAFT_111962 [Guillardia theta CCMP2712]|eukprot:XP_005829090.1 hypothetical protein GUITHDRAFT_111962 [Guillardia theta CCMP2712]
MAAAIEEVARVRAVRETNSANRPGHTGGNETRTSGEQVIEDKELEVMRNSRRSVQIIPFLASLVASARAFKDVEKEKKYTKFFLTSIFRSDNVFLRSVFILALTYNGGVLAVRIMSHKSLSLSDFLFMFRFVILLTCWLVITVSDKLPAHYLTFAGRWLNWVVELRIFMFAVDHLRFEILYDSAFIASISLSLGCIVISPRFWPLNVRRTATICFVGNLARLLWPSKRLALNEEIDSLVFSITVFVLGNLGSVSFHAFMRQKFTEKWKQEAERMSQLQKGNKAM